MARKRNLSDDALVEGIIDTNDSIGNDEIDESKIDLSGVEDVSPEDLVADEKEYSEDSGGGYVDPVRAYVAEMRRYPMLSSNDEVNRLWNKGDVESKNKIVCGNLRLAFHIAKKYQNRGVALLDLIQEANIGLVKSVDHYDPNMGYKFSTYATWWITAYVRRCIQANSSSMRLPVYIVEMIGKIRTAQQYFETNNMEYDEEDIANATGLKVSDVKKALAAQQKSEVLSLDYETNDEKGNCLGDTLVDENENVESNFVANEREQRILQLINEVCSPREADIIVRHFGFIGRKETFDELAESYNVSKQRIGQLYKRAMTKLQEPKAKRKFEKLIN